MARSFDPRRDGEDNIDPDQFTPVEEESAVEPEAPRRAASARLDVSAAIGSEALLREAMDPANQSLREALRLSYRVLQVVILVLIVLFIFSGFTTVQTQETGVMLRWGKIVGESGAESLEPGAHFSIFPYPVGEFVIFEDKNRPFDLQRALWPSHPGRTFEQAVDNAMTSEQLQPRLAFAEQRRGQGYAITAEGDIVHLQLRGEFEIESPVDFLQRIEISRSRPSGLDGERLVQLAMLRAATLSAAKTNLSRIVEMSEQEKYDIRAAAQQLLDRTGAGVRISQINAPVSPTPALAIRKADDELQQTRAMVGSRIEHAEREAQRKLLAMAGMESERLLELISEYEAAADEDPESGTDVLQRINALLESPEMQGEVAAMISEASAYRSFIEYTLGNEVRRFRALLGTFERNPELVISEHWSDMLSYVRSRVDLEQVGVPTGVGRLQLVLSGNQEVSRIRRQLSLDRRERDAWTSSEFMGGRPLPRAADMQSGGPGRQLDRQGNPLRRD